MKKIDVSVIMPIYNAEKYLGRAIKSVLTALENYQGKSEFLLVDNNSTDDSASIIQQFAETYPDTIIALKCTTPGAGAARNFAAKKARGEYFWFVDADDEIAPESVADLMQAALKADADLVTLGLRKIFPDGHEDMIPAFSPKDPDFRSRFIRGEPGPVQVFVRRKWYEAQGFKFIEGMIHEDMEMMPAVVLYTDKVASVDKPLYLYYQNPNSTLHRLEWDPHYFDIFPALEGLMARFEKAEAVETYHAELEWFFVWNLLMDSVEYFSKFPQGKAGLKKSREMLKKYFPHWRRNKFLKNTNLRTHLKILVNYHR